MAKQKSFQVGSKIEGFEIESSSGKTVTEKDFLKQYSVIYFYPKDSTPGCTLEGQQFQKLLPQFKKLGAKIYGVSRDSVASHCKFADKQGFQFELLSDSDEHFCHLFDVIKLKNMYGKKVMGIERSTFIIDPQLKLVREWRKVKADGHAAEVLTALKELA